MNNADTNNFKLRGASVFNFMRAGSIKSIPSLDASTTTSVPFFRPSLSDAEIEEVVDTLRSGWLTTGPKVRQFERKFAEMVRSRHAVSVNSCTAALHLAVEALGLRPGEGVMVPTMTFAATAEVIRYQGAIPILVDCDPETLNLDLDDAGRKVVQLRQGKLPPSIPKDTRVVGIIPVHVGGLMLNCDAIRAFADREGLWIVEDAAHAFPSGWRPGPNDPWQNCGEGTARVSCFSFYANKTITTGEGGMAVTDSDELANRIRMMSLHGLTHDAWSRYSSGGSWDYKIGAPGFKYNLTDIAAAIGIHQLARSAQMRNERESIAKLYREQLRDSREIELPPDPQDRIHSWHLFPIKLRLDRLSVDRNAFIEALKHAGIGCSVHWRPLHLHPYYLERFGWRTKDLPVASAVWKRLISLPIFPGMREEEIAHVIRTVRGLCAVFGLSSVNRSGSSPRSKSPALTEHKMQRTSSSKPIVNLGKGIPRPVEAILALVGLVGSAPLIAVSALAIRLTSPGTVFFKQMRAGRNGRSFVLVKLRTMRSHEGGPQVTAMSDSRVTFVGRFLRKTKLDELPELWNVLRGDMSLVGPRPEVPRYVDLKDPRWQAVLQARPGLTDPVTLRLRNEEKLLAEVEGDIERFYLGTLQPVKLGGYLEYLQSRNWKEDLKVFFKTAVGVAWSSESPAPTVAQIRLEASALNEQLETVGKNP